MASTKQILKILLVLSYLLVLVGSQSSACVSRRCLANEFIKKDLYSPPQPPGCAITVNLTSIQYQTLSVDTKTLRFSSRLKITMQWKDPDLAWTESQYRFKDLIMPSSKMWTPHLTVDNAVYTDVKPVSKDILVKNDGTVSYSVIMYITVMCGINLFTYPFVSESCPVALNGWNQSSCGLTLLYGRILIVGGDRGEWKTLSVNLHGKGRNYLNVFLSLNPFNAVVALVLPTALIMIVDLVSFALPLDGGERNSFKIKLVFSFTMFLMMLCKQVPVSGRCSPLIYFHYCFCLIVLVVSVLISMILTRLSKTGTAYPSCPNLSKIRRLSELFSFKARRNEKSPEKMAGIDLTDGLKTSEKLAAKPAAIQSACRFVENMDKDVREKETRLRYAKSWDRICFFTYLSLDIIYGIAITVFSTIDFCTINNVQF
ncbi:5-hydroxytryptamine receptor 3A-like [Astyanax mexicanus]|uniref:5-hydroxytryptamine receptor 3A-like n=1 Tax=Astyanax mexicanus TaxID=7994 RepID=A0A8T2L3I1_ASTMX|nr:5-hydroxytryptamine receptor 3A-like [Astyanax mexicanus]